MIDRPFSKNIFDKSKCALNHFLDIY